MAALRHPLASEDRFQQASEELGAVVNATEIATNTIITCTEEIEEIIHELRAQLPEGYQSSRVNDMNEAVVKIFEACNFQDLTGQRITKVVRALSFIEERVEAMMGVWNKREFETMPLPPGMAAKEGDLEPTRAKQGGSGQGHDQSGGHRRAVWVGCWAVSPDGSGDLSMVTPSGIS